MERLKQPGKRAWSFFFGRYGGAPVDYLLAIAAIYAAMVVCVVRDFLSGTG